MFHLAILGLGEWWPILIIVVLLFGASKLPELGRSLGSGLSNFKKGLKDGEEGPTLPEPRSATRAAADPAKSAAPTGVPATPPSDPQDS